MASITNESQAIKSTLPVALDMERGLTTIDLMYARPIPDTKANSTDPADKISVDLADRAQWLRAAVLGANDGLLSTAALMMGVGAVKKDIKIMILTGIAGLVAGACSMAMGEFVSVYSQYDIEFSQMKRENEVTNGTESDLKEIMKELPSPTKAAVASAVSFAVGAAVPLLAAAFVKEYAVRLGVVVAAVSMALVVFGGVGAVLGKAAPVKGAVRVLIGGWIAMGVTFGLTKLVGSNI